MNTRNFWRTTAGWCAFIIVLLGSLHIFAPVEVWGKILALDWGNPEDFPELQQRSADGVAFILTDTLYYAGGWIGVPTNPFADMYTLSLPAGKSDQWSSSVTSSLNPGRFGLASATHQGNVYIFGGYSDGYLTKVERFDGQQWHEMPQLPGGQGRAFLAATALDEYIYIAGGLPGPTDQVRRAQIKPNGDLVWVEESEKDVQIPNKLSGLGLVSYENCLFVVGGKDAGGQPRSEIYAAQISQADGSLGEWKLAANSYINGDPNTKLAFHGTTVHQDKLYILGGETPGAGFSSLGFSVSLKSDCTLGNDWESFTLPNDVGLRRLAVASRWGELYIIGGQSANGYVADAWQATLDTPPVELTLHKSMSLAGDFDYGKRITYTLSYANPWAHPEGQHNVVITDTLQHGIELESISNNGEFNKANRQLSWALDDLRQGEVGAVSFVARVQSPPLNWTVKSNMETHFLEDSTMTLEMPNGLSYTIIYTLSGHPAPAGALITATLPEQIHPTWITSDISYTTQGQHIIWRAPEAISGTTETLQVHACVTPSIYTDEVLTFTVLVEDEVQQHAPFIFTSSIDSERHDLLSHTCSGWLTETHELAPLYPSARIANQAWICSEELGCQPSNETVTRYWPLKIFLPLLARNN